MLTIGLPKLVGKWWVAERIVLGGVEIAVEWLEGCVKRRQVLAIVPWGVPVAMTTGE